MSTFLSSLFLQTPKQTLSDRAIGCIDLNSCSGQGRCRDKSAELSYALSSMHWGKGIATRVVKQVVETAFSEFPYLERVQALVDVENVASQGVLEKAGFQREGSSEEVSVHQGKK